jgi:queuosine precursor transporter
MLTSEKFAAPKYLNMLAMLYLTIALITIVLIYKVTSVHHFTISAASFVIPVWFVLADIIAEVYGYLVLKKIILTTLLCEFIFIGLIELLIQLPINTVTATNNAYQILFGDLYRVFIGSALAVLLGSFLNGYLLVKWKLLTKGRFFWIRSIGSSAIGEGLFTIIVFLIEFMGKVSTIELIEMIVISYIVKVIFLPIAATPALIVANMLKLKENFYDEGFNQKSNPLKFSLD